MVRPGGVLDEVGEHLVHLHRVDVHLGEVRLDDDCDTGGVPSESLEPASTRRDDLADVARRTFGDERAGLDPRHAEQIANDPVESIALVDHHVQQFRSSGRVVIGAVEKVGRDRLDRGERAAQIVGHATQQDGPLVVQRAGRRSRPARVTDERHEDGDHDERRQHEDVLRQADPQVPDRREERQRVGQGRDDGDDDTHQCSAEHAGDTDWNEEQERGDCCPDVPQEQASDRDERGAEQSCAESNPASSADRRIHTDSLPGA